MGNPKYHYVYLMLFCCARLLLSSAPAAADNASAMPDQLAASKPNITSTAVQSPTMMEWVNSAGFTAAGDALLSEIQRVSDDGLEPERYHYSSLQQLKNQAWDPSLVTTVNRVMNTVFEQLITDLGQGMLKPTDVQKKWYQWPEPVDSELAYLSLQLPENSVESVIEQHRPALVDYSSLSSALVHYQQLADLGGWDPIEAGQTIRLGMSDPRLASIESRLNMTGDLPVEDMSLPGDEPLVLTEGVVRAVKRFQHRHGLGVDGNIGEQTLAAMNISVEEKVQTLKINLERLRWLPRDLGERHIITNIAGFSLRVFEHDLPILSMPVIVGKKKFKTPVFSDQIEFMVVNPYWRVPTSILYNELLPAERRNPGYLARNDFELIGKENGRAVVRNPNSIDRSRYHQSRFGYMARQKPGKRNALGKVKFIFPNRYSVYLHDTPARKLFQRDYRAFSHGCIRVGNPKGLAETLLEFDGWDAQTFESAYQVKKRSVIDLKQPVKNHITYLTSWVDDEYQTHFRADIYKHDKDLIGAMQNPPSIPWPGTTLAALEE